MSEQPTRDDRPAGPGTGPGPRPGPAGVLEPWWQAYRELGLSPDAHDGDTVRRAYRRAVRQHPPDRDPEGFRRVRAAYERLGDPERGAREALLHPAPLVPPPAPDVAPAPEAERLSLTVLRRLTVRALDARALLGEPSTEQPR